MVELNFAIFSNGEIIKNLFTNRRRYARFLYKLIVPFVSATGNGGICYTQKRTS